MNRSGPFGLQIGMSFEEVEGQKTEIKPGVFQVTPPKPHSAFDTYYVRVAPKAGLSWAKAIGVPIKTSVYGTELRTALEGMKERLSGVYGNCKFSDMLMPDSIWNEPRDYTQSLLSGQRILHAF